MADYPSIPYVVSATKDRMSGRIVERTDSGALRVRQMYSEIKRKWHIEHYVTQSDADVLRDHYDAHQGATFLFVDQQSLQQYTVAYTGDMTESYIAQHLIVISVDIEQV